MEKSDALEIYKAKLNEQISLCNLHRQTSQQYFALISAIFAASLVVFIKNEIISIVSLFGFGLNIFLGISAIMLCRKYYRRFLEEITIMAKMEPLIGLNDLREEKDGNIKFSFPKDKFYIPDRWMNDRKKFDKSGKFIESQEESGVDKYIRLSFKYLIGVNIIFGVIIIIRFLLECRWKEILLAFGFMT